MKAQIAAIIALVALVGCKPNAPPPPAIPEPFSSGNELLQAMHDRYADRWTRSLTYVQSRSDPSAATAAPRVWYDAFLAPAILRIDYDPINAGNGRLQRGDTLYAMQRGNLIETTTRPDPLLVLQFAVYHLAPATTTDMLRRSGFDLARIRQDNWEGRQVYVVGSPHKEFWVDREQLLIVRVIQPGEDSNGDVDLRWRNYKQIGRSWVAPLLETYKDGRLLFKEDRQIMRIDAPVDTAMFRPDQWSTARHWYNQR